MQPERHFTTRQVAEICGVNLNTVQNWARRSVIGGFRTAGGHLRFRESDLVAFLDRQGIPRPRDLERRRPTVYCLSCGRTFSEAVAKWLRRDFDAHVYEDPWEMVLAVGLDRPDLVLLECDASSQRAQSIVRALGRNPTTAAVPVVIVADARSSSVAACPEATIARLPRRGLTGTEVRKEIQRLIASA